MRKTILLGAFGTLICLFTTAQKISLEQFKNWKPRNIGPAGMSGRITTIDVVLENPNIIYLGAASGGVWKTEYRFGCRATIKSKYCLGRNG